RDYKVTGVQTCALPISHHYFSTVKKKRMIVSRVGCKARVKRHFANGEVDRVEFSAISKTETALTGGQSSEQAHESRSKKREANRHANWQLPLGDQLPPQKREHNEVGPDSYL